MLICQYCIQSRNIISLMNLQTPSTYHCECNSEHNPWKRFVISFPTDCIIVPVLEECFVNYLLDNGIGIDSLVVVKGSIACLNVCKHVLPPIQ